MSSSSSSPPTNDTALNPPYNPIVPWLIWEYRLKSIPMFLLSIFFDCIFWGIIIFLILSIDDSIETI